MAGVEWDESEEWGPQDESLLTPLMTIDRPTVLTFETFCQYGIPDYYDHYKVDVLNTSTGSWNTLWDAVEQPEWVNQFQEPVSIDLSAYQGQNIRLRFRAHNNGSDILTYSWFIDNVKVVATDTIPQAVNENYLMTNMYPNPVSGDMAKVCFELKNDAKVSYQVFDITGRMVRNEYVGTFSEGTHEANVSVSDLANGSYILRLNAGNSTSSVKFMVF